MKLSTTLLLLGLSVGALAQGTQTPGTAQASLDITNINANILTGGDFFRNALQPGFEMPRGSGKHTIFGGALWLGGKDQQNNLYLSTQTDRQNSQAGYWPGPIGNTQGPAHTAAYDKIWKVSKTEIQNHLANYNKPGYAAPADIASWPAHGIVANGEAANLAPFEDQNNDGVYSPAQGDYPKILGDQALYLILNDKGNQKVPASPTMNAEIHIMFYGYNNPTDTAGYQTIFSKYRIINRGQTNLKEVYAGIWTNLDIGYSNDDMVGCDVGLDGYFGYNGDLYDDLPSGYGYNPPAQGVIFLDKKMSYFLSYNNDTSSVNGNPATAQHYYNYLTGKWKNNNPTTYGSDGTDQTKPPYRFMFPGISDPQGNGFSATNTPVPAIPVPSWDWTEFNRDGNAAQNPAADRRGVGSIGPFNLAAGQELTFTVAYTNWDMQSVRDFFQNNVIAGTRPETEKQPLRLFPNPASDQLTIQLPDNFGGREATVIITDFTGREVLKTNAPQHTGHNFQLNIASLSKGIYRVSVISGTQRVASRLVKM